MADGALQPGGELPPLDLYIEAVERLRLGEYGIAVPEDSPDPFGRLGQSLTGLSRELQRRYLESTRLDAVAARMNAGMLLDEVLEGVYRDFRELIPYHRIGVALLENDGRLLRARWARSEQPRVLLTRGFSAALAGSSLEEILRTGRPRILNDLAAYAAGKPGSHSTRLILEEGYRSSLTCPLIANGVPTGFVFFSSTAPDTYSEGHVQTFLRIAGQLATVVEKARYLTQLAEQQEQLARQNATLRQLNELKNTFLGIAAHDLRNPIGNIRGIAQLLLLPEYDPEPPERASHLQDIERQAAYMQHLLTDLLDVSQIEAGKLTLRLQPLEVGNLLREALGRFARLAGAKGSHLRLESVPGGSLAGDTLRLRQVLDNLISNAIKYAPPGTTITVGAASGTGEWRLSVRDEGPGLSLADQGRLFQDFVPLTARPTGGESSTGLGLAISRRVVEAHGGRIGVDSLPGHGATFWFTIPAATEPPGVRK